MNERLLGLGVGRVIAFNWPKYVVATIVLIGCIIATIVVSGAARAVAFLGALGLGYGIMGSLFATWWAYDHRADDLYQKIARQHTATDQSDWILVHAGLDESRARLSKIIGQPVQVFDVGPTNDTSRSLRRAHSLIPRTGQVIETTTNYATGLPDGSVDTVVLLFGIHEIGNGQNAANLLLELGRVVRSAGSIVIVEHLRDIPNAVVYGPAVLHFGSGRHWKRVIANSSLHIRSSERVAGLISVFNVNHG
jgi:SAM-dependent methyltransferase